MADAFGRVLNDGKAIERLVQDNRSLAEKVRDVLADIVNAVKRVLNHQNLELTAEQKAEFRELESRMGEMERLFSDALGKAAWQTGTGNGTMNVKHSLKSMTESERSALLQYKSSESYKTNAKLRDGIDLTETEQTMVNELDRALEKLPSVDGTVYRTLNCDDVFDPKEEYEAFIAAHQEGDIVHYNAYTSASTKTDGYPLDEGVQYGVMLNISGQNAKDLSGIGNNFESEALFPRGTEFAVTKVAVDKNGHTHVYLEEAATDVQRNESKYDTQKRGKAVQQMQKTGELYGDLSAVSEKNSKRGADRGRLPGVRGEGTEKVKFSLKEDSQGRKLTRRALQGARGLKSVRRKLCPS